MKHEEGKQKQSGALAALTRYKYVLPIAALGVLLLLWPSREKETQAEVSPAPSAADAEDLEQDMEDILGKIRGVGRVEVMLTMQSGGELVLASDSTLRYSGATHAPDDYDRSTEIVTVSGESGGQDVVVTQRKSPQYRGALVVCEGGENDAVRLQVIQAVSALTGLGSDRIAVVPWQSAAAVQEDTQ